LTKKLIGYGAVGLVIAIALIAGVQMRPQNLLPSTGQLQVSIIGDPLTSDPLTVTCHGDSTHVSQNSRGQNITITSLVVNISSIQVHRTGALNLTGEWVTLSDAPKSLDLLNLKSFDQIHGSASLPDGVINLVRLTVGPTAVAMIGTSSRSVVVSSGHLDAQTNAQVTSGRVTSITLELVRPHIACEGNATLRLTPQLTVSSETTS
jgi:Domain of unknown function (DUF4382)